MRVVDGAARKDDVTTDAEAAAKPKRKQDPDASRARILEAAANEFGRSGYAGARVEEIAKRARMSPRMLYHYFGSKEQLYAAVAYENYRRIFLRMAEVQAENAHLPVVERLRNFLLAFFEATHTDQIYFRFEQWESAGGWQLMKHVRRDEGVPSQEVSDRFLGDLEEGIRSGVLRADLNPIFLVTISGTLSIYYPAYLPRARQIFGPLPYGEESTPRGREELVEFFLRGLLAHPDAPPTLTANEL